jgi:hypothetical protein
MDWQDLLAAIDAGLERLDARLNAFAAAPDQAPPVVYDPARTRAAAGECLVAVGRHRQPGDTPGEDIDHAGICLNDKGLAPNTGAQRAVGVTALALGPPDWLLAQWQQAVGNAAAPSAFFERFTLVVEDASADCCLGLIVLVARLNGVAAAALPTDWTRYVAGWERGESRTADPYRAWGPLLSALAHGHFDRAAFREPAAGEAAADLTSARNLALGQAWLACLRLTLAALRSGSPPEPLAALPACPELEQALAALRFEEQVYRQAIDQTERLQLRLPVAGPGNRWRLVDACLLEEVSLTGALKVFLRNDRERAWLGDGFGLIALHRPELAGSGDDITISVDPATGTQLQALWGRLEALEDQAGPRDTSKPRLVAAYPNGRRPDGAPSPSQPWWDDRGSCTLIAAPRRQPDGTPGSRLDWPAVLDALWDCYRPDRDLLLAGPDCLPRPLAEHRAEPIRDTDQHRLDLAWPRADAGGRPIHQPAALLTPTLQRLLAAAIADAAQPAAERRRLAHLPPLDALDLLPLPGGLAVVHQAGVLLLDDWRAEALCSAAIDREIKRVAERLRFLDREGSDAEGLIGRLGARIERGRLPRPRDLRQLAGLKLRLHHCLNATAADCDDPRLQRLRESLERRWGSAARLARLDRTLGDLDAALGTLAGQRSAGLINALTLFGFPLLLFAGFFQFMLADLPRDWAALPAWLHGVPILPTAATVPTATGPHWPALALYAVLSGIGMVVIALWIRLRGSGFGGRRGTRTEGRED